MPAVTRKSGLYRAAVLVVLSVGVSIGLIPSILARYGADTARHAAVETKSIEPPANLASAAIGHDVL